jgi:hypothetical protein
MRSGHRGDYWIGGYEAHGDEAVGTLTSVAFRVTQPYASFLIGGGSGNATRVEILNAENGMVLFRTTGPDDEKMRPEFVDLRPFAGAKIQIRIVDEATTGWGHVNFDDFVFNDARPTKSTEVKSAPLAANLPSHVNLRPQFEAFGLAQRGQGSRGTCSVFSTVENVEFAAARATGNGRALSVEFANWAANAATGRSDDGDFFHNIILGIEKFGVCNEATMPYGKEFSADTKPSEAATAEAARFRDSTPIAFHWIRSWKEKPGLNDADIWHMKSVIASGWPVSAGSYHSILFVGYEDDPSLPGGGRFLVADSNLAEHDITYAAAKKRMCDLFYVTASRRL